jgi:transposase
LDLDKAEGAIVLWDMAKGRNVVFKEYDPDQAMLLPPSLEELISKAHAVRVVASVIERIDIEPLVETYKGGGTSSYHPRMLLKVLVYAYLNNIYSSRRIEGALKENIHFMWLSGMKRPDHHTINRFRGQRLKNNIREVFTQVVLLLMEAGHVDLKAVYTDGTKLEANANKYTFVWAKSIATNKKKMKARLEELWDYAQGVAAEELRGEDPGEMQELDPQKVEQTIDAINAALKGKPVEKEVQQKLSYARKNWGPNLRKYRMQELILGERGSYSKTDPHATFMRMKDDHMGNGQLKAGYNVQWSTQDQFIVHYSLHQDTTDTKTLIPHYEQLKAQLGKLPGAAVADAGYGSEQNYEYLEAESVEAFVKYNYFHREQQKSHQEKYPFEQGRLYYNAARNEYTCPMGQPMRHIGDQRSTTKAGHPQNVSRYQAHNCAGCPLNGACHKAKGNRIIEVNHRLNQLKAQARELLTSEEGLRHRSTRPIEVESAFGNLKQNKGFTRFMLRGLHKVTLEIGLLSTAINLKKWARILQNKTEEGLQSGLSCLRWAIFQRFATAPIG